MAGGARRGRRTSLTSIATAAAIVAVLALVVGTTVVWAGFTSLLRARQHLYERVQPASVDARRLGAALIDQETGIRGFALTRDDRLLDPYRDGHQEQDQIVAALHRSFGDRADAAAMRIALDSTVRAMDAWRREVAAPILARPVPESRVDAVFLASKTSFDRVRRQLEALDAEVDAARREANADLDRATTQLIWSVAGAMIALAAASTGVAWLLRRRVVRPINQLVEAADGVVLDRLEDPIVVDGPAEIEHLAAQVGAMRDRIVTELAVVEAARRDIDEWAAELARSNDDLEQFAYVASHDLQEPLRKVASFCQLIEQRYGDQLDERGRSYIEYAVDGAKRMQALINDLLDFSRVGRTTEAFVPCDLDALAREVVAHAADALGDAEVSIAPLPTVPGDPILYRALLANLVSNAAKYRSPDRRLELRLDAERDGDEWVFACTDNGLGIDPRFNDRVFAIFQRLHAADRYEGTGIGLALCRKIVEFSGGRIWIDPPPPTGTSIRWTLPVASTAHHRPGRPAEPPLPRRTEEPA